MFEGKCPKCGAKYVGWALRWPRHQSCARCGMALEITEDGQKFTGYSPFTAEEYTITPPPSSTPADKKESPVEEE